MHHIAVSLASLSNSIGGVDEHSYIDDSIQNYHFGDGRPHHVHGSPSNFELATKLMVIYVFFDSSSSSPKDLRVDVFILLNGPGLSSKESLRSLIKVSALGRVC